jgi:isoleucyl-tRNA synthetase
LGHAARKSAQIRVRQPLKELKVLNQEKLNFPPALIQLIKNELNVKGVSFTGGKGEIEVKLETKMTSQLKKEGEDRELIRQIQEARKEKGCQLDEKVIVVSPQKAHDITLVAKQALVKEFKKGPKFNLVRS